MNTAGAFRLEPRQIRLSSRLQFGKHKGKRLDELPGDYLEWLLRTEPRFLQPGQLDEASKILTERRKERFREEAADNGHAQQAAQTDPVLQRALDEKRFRPGPTILGPEFDPPTPDAS
jgi:uncharacterized protein (DUF3820 family)